MAAPYFSTDPFFGKIPACYLRPSEDVPLELARRVAETVAEACQIVHDPKHRFVGHADAPAFTDEQVALVMAALQCQLDKEGRSRTAYNRELLEQGHPPSITCSRCKAPHTHWYTLAELPPARQRALCERIWALKQEWGGEVRVWYEGDVIEPPPSFPPLFDFAAAVTAGFEDWWGY